MSRRALFGILLSLAASDSAIAQTTFVSDTFTVAANTLLEAHAPNTGGAWTRQSGNGITLNAAADNARNVSTSDWSVYTNATVAPAAEVVLGVTVTFTSANANNFVDLFGRGSISLLSAYSVRIAGAGANNVTLSRWSGGAPTTLAQATVAISINTPISVLLSLKNASKSVQINGVTVASSADNTVTAAGIVALGMQSNGANQTIADTFFASTFAPTAVDRIDAFATRDATRTMLEWSTAREVQNLGFRVYRDDGHGRTLVSHALIAGAGFLVASGSLPAGNTYRWLDSDPNARVARAWWIEDVDIYGRSTWHGPIVPRHGRIDSRFVPSPALVDLQQRNGVAAAPSRLFPASLVSLVANRRRAVDLFAGPRERQRQLAAANTIKIEVTRDGLYRVARAELIAAGLDVPTDLQTLRLFADGLEEPLDVEGDAILFYGRALDTPSSASRVYWLLPGEGTGMRMAVSSPASAPNGARRSFMATAERRDKLLFFTFLRNADGDNFVGPVVSTDASKPTTQTLTLRHIDRAATDATLTVELQGAIDAGIASDHLVAVSVNGQHVGDAGFSGMDRPVTRFAVPAELLAEGDNTIALIARNGDEDISAVVSVALTYAHTLEADDDHLLAVVDGGVETSITGFTSGGIDVLDVTNERAPIRIVPVRTEAGTVTFVAPESGSRTILAVTSATLEHAASIARNEPAALHAADGADVVIISHPSFAGALAPLVQLREAQGLRAMVVKIDDVYDEYSFGAKDPEAIRTFLRDARQWQHSPRYVLLVGDASMDSRNYLGFGDFDYVPTKLVVADLLDTASDAWFTDFDEDGAADIPIGRLSARVPSEVDTEVGKIVTYETSTAPPAQKIMLVSDADPALDFHANSLSLEGSIPGGFAIVDIDSASSGAATAREEILTGFRDALLVNYIGHGSVEIWSNENFFNRADVADLSKGDHAPIVVAMTCLNGYFHDVYTDSLAETLLRAPNGAVAVWASSALTSPEAQLPANEVLLAALLAPGDVRLGDAVLAAQKSSFTPDVRRTFILFGDPAMRVRPHP